MTKLIPIFTEKSLINAKNGKYSFWVTRTLGKNKIKHMIEEIFDVKVDSIKTAKKGGKKKKNFKGQVRNILSKKKAIVSLKGKDTIDLFDEEKKTTKKKAKQS